MCVVFHLFDGRGVEARGSMMGVERMDLGVSPFIEYLPRV